MDSENLDDVKLAFSLVLASRTGDTELADAACARFTSPRVAVVSMDRVCQFLAALLDATGVNAEAAMRDVIEGMAALS